MTRLLTPCFNYLTPLDSPNFWHIFHEPLNTLLIVHSSNSKKPCWFCCHYLYGRRNI